MPLSDYAHWNEDAPRVWWEEEGRHESGEPDYDRVEELLSQEDDLYDDGYRDAEDGEACHPPTDVPRLRRAYLTGYKDGTSSREANEMIGKEWS